MSNINWLDRQERESVSNPCSGLISNAISLKGANSIVSVILTEDEAKKFFTSLDIVLRIAQTLVKTISPKRNKRRKRKRKKNIHKGFISNRSYSLPEVHQLQKTMGHKEWYKNVYLKSEYWRGVTLRVRSNRKCCEVCGRDNNLEVHHLNYSCLFVERDTDLKLVCHLCHLEIHGLTD